MPEPLAGRRILLTSGPTRAPIDAVRYIGNRSSGRLGSAIAGAALRAGAHVTMVAGPQSAVPERLPPEDAARLRLVRIETVPELIEALRSELSTAPAPDAIVHAMAVLDYAPAAAERAKTPSGRPEWTLRLVPTPKVIKLIRQWAPEAFLVAFKLEVGVGEERLRELALASLEKNRADLVVANDLERIGGEAHPALIVGPGGAVLARPGTKEEIAARLCELLAERLPDR